MTAPEPFVLPAGPVRLRPWRDDDLDDTWEALQDPDIRLWNGDGSASRELGSVSLFRIDRVQGSAEIGYWTTPAARGRGAATNAVAAVCAWAFDVLGLERIELRHAVANPASSRIATKAGFTLEGRTRSSYVYGDGARHDELLWSRLRGDPMP